MRFDAVQASKTDMVAQEDIDHFVVCETLCKYLDPLSYQKIHEISVVMREAIVNGHNVVKLRSVTPPEEAR